MEIMPRNFEFVKLKVVLICLLVVVTSRGALIEHHGDLRLIDNGYEGLVISISDQIPEDHCNQVVAGIKVGRS